MLRQSWSIGLSCLLFAASVAAVGSNWRNGSSQLNSGKVKYPEHWWTPISKAGAPSWEVMPQEAGPGEVILSKRNELGLLSNFAATPFEYHGKHYASLEGFWQMMKYPEGPDDP